jgi:acetyl esterase
VQNNIQVLPLTNKKKPVNLLYTIYTKLSIVRPLTTLVKTLIVGLLLLPVFIGCTQKSEKHSDLPALKKQFDENAAKTNKALEKYVPQGISAILDQPYDGSKNASLDVYFPSELEKTGKALPVIVWIHGGGWITGDKANVANYCKILAGKGYTTVAINYTLAPEGTYPTPVRQANKALEYLAANAARLHIDPAHFILAGNSAGASVAAQLANAISLPSYAQALEVTPSVPRSQLSGILLYCGPYDITESNHKEYVQSMDAFLKAYSGTGNYENNSKFATFKVAYYVTATFPPAFISAGNADPLLPSSQDLARKLSAACVKVDTVFFAQEQKPAQTHDYQFNLDSDEANVALARSMIFLSSLKMSKPD